MAFHDLWAFTGSTLKFPATLVTIYCLGTVLRATLFADFGGVGLTRRGPACRAEFGLGAQVFSANPTLPKDEDLVTAMGAKSGHSLH